MLQIKKAENLCYCISQIKSSLYQDLVFDTLTYLTLKIPQVITCNFSLQYSYTI